MIDYIVRVVVSVACCGGLVVLLLLVLGMCIVAGGSDRDREDEL